MKTKKTKTTKQEKDTTGIYKITNPKGKVYIGKSINIFKRWRWYKGLYNNEQPKLQYSLKKYGFENHKFEIIEECRIKELIKKEIYWKEFYLSKVNEKWEEVLFLNLLDDGGGPLSSETREKIRQAKLGFKHSEETKRKIGEGNRGKIISEETKQKQRKPKSEETKQKMRVSKPKALDNKCFKSVIQYSLEMNPIKEWSSMKEAGEFLDIGPGDIGACCRGRQQTAGGFKWKYKI